MRDEPRAVAGWQLVAARPGRTAAGVVNAAGLAQGIALVTFPAASTIFTAPGLYGLSASEYGLMFVPQVITAIVASLVAAGLIARRLAARTGDRGLFLAGLLADLAAMLLLIVSWLVVHQHGLAFGLLLAGTACLGAGFGLAVPALNTLAAGLHPRSVDRSVLVLNALLGLGTALAPIFVAVFLSIGFWVGLPILAAALLVAVFVISLPLPLQPAPPADTAALLDSASSAGAAAPAKVTSKSAAAGGTAPDNQSVAHRATADRTGASAGLIPARFWSLGAFALLYGICETMNGNWSQLYVTSLGVTSTTAALALTAFWALVTAGRVLFAAVQRWLPSRFSYHGLPFVLVAAFLLTAVLPRNAPAVSVAVFALAGLGCSALLPLTISIGQEKLAEHQLLVAGGVIACYQVGYGIAAFGVGPLTNVGVRLPVVFGGCAVIAAALGAVSWMVAHRRPSPRTLHPQPWSRAAGRNLKP